MCGGGGKAAQLEAQQEQERQDTINGNIADINKSFSGRSADYDKYRAALTDQYQTELNRQQGIASRNNKFALARNGTTGGSAATDAGTLLAQEMAKGTVSAQQGVNSGVAKLTSQDEATRQQMISLAQSGGDIGDAAKQTATQLQANIGNAENQNAAQGLGDVFANTTAGYKSEQDAAALRTGVLKGQQYAKSGLGG